MKTIGWQRNAVSLVLWGTLAAAGSPALAGDDFASVVTAAGVAIVDPPATACDLSLKRGLGFESSGAVSCNVGAAAVSISAVASAPSGTMPGQLAELHAATRIEIAPGGPARAPYTVANALALANFRDYVNLGAVRPDHMTFDFGLTGTLFVSGPFGLDQSSSVDMSIYAQSGVYAPPVFFSYPPLAAGRSDAVSSLIPGQPIQSSLTNQAGNSPDFHFVATAPGQYELTLGASFFDDLSNTQVLLEFGLLSQVRLTDYGSNSLDLVASSDFSHTLRMTDLHAFAADGHDVTSDAFLGFASAGLAGVPAVPEPSEWLLMLAGLVWVGTKTSRRSLR